MTSEEEQELRKPVFEAVETAIAKGKVVKREWMVHEIVKDRQFAGPDRNWLRLTAYYAIKDLVGRAIRAFAKAQEEDESNPQMILKGYERLQKSYALTRDDEIVFVPIEQCTDEELEAKAVEHEAQSQGHLDHARELRRYIAKRKKAQRA